MIKRISLSILAALITHNASAGVRGESIISTDGKVLVQLQDWPYADQIKVYDLATKSALLTIPNANALIFDDVSKTSCFASQNEFAFVKSISPHDGYYRLIIFRITDGSVVADKVITKTVAIACNSKTNEVLLAEQNSIQILDSTTLTEKRRVSVDNFGAGVLNGLGQIILSPDGKLAALTNPISSDNRPSFKVIDLESGRVVATDSLPVRREIQSLVFSPDSDFVAIVATDGIGKVYSVPDGKMVAEFGHNALYERMKVRFDIQGRMFVVDQYNTRIGHEIVVTNFGNFPFARHWRWVADSSSLEFNSFEVSMVTGQLMIDTMESVYLIDSATGIGRAVQTSCINLGRWLFSPSQPILINAHETCGLTEIGTL